MLFHFVTDKELFKFFQTILQHNDDSFLFFLLNPPGKGSQVRHNEICFRFVTCAILSLLKNSL